MKLNDIDTEKAFLGSVLLENSLLDECTITAEMFSSELYRKIYSIMQKLHTQRKAVDLVTMGTEVDLETMTTILSISNSVSTSANAQSYADIMKSCYVARRLLELANKTKVWVEESEDVSDTLELIQTELLDINLGRNLDDTVSIKDSLEESINVLSHSQMEGNYGLKSEFIDFDNITGGLKAGTLEIIAARPAMGKTAFALNLATNFAKQGKKVLMFSLEMTNVELTNRILGIEARITGDKFNKPETITSEDWDRIFNNAERISQMPIRLYDKPDMRPSEIRSVARKEKLKRGLDVIIIDYLQLMSGNRKSENRQQEVTEISRMLKTIAKDLQVPVIALSQLSRGVESRQDKRPMLMDLRESGAIEQDADMVMFLYRDEYYNPETEIPHVTELIIAKHRQGECATINLFFDSSTTTFKSLSKNNYHHE